MPRIEQWMLAAIIASQIGKNTLLQGSENKQAHDQSPSAEVDEQSQRLATLGVLAGSIAHEVNNLLTPVLSYAQLALQNSEDVELTEKALQKAVAGTEKVGHIMSSLLGFVRNEGDVRDANISICVREALNCLARDLSKDNITLSQDIENDLVAKISPIALQQVVLNLLLNARDAMLPGRGELVIRARRSTWNNQHNRTLRNIEIEIQDSGCGMDERMLEDAFLPFVSNRHNPANGVGTGLGLPICRQLIEEVGGTIEARSAIGAGTTFVITLEETRTEKTRNAA